MFHCVACRLSLLPLLLCVPSSVLFTGMHGCFVSVPQATEKCKWQLVLLRCNTHDCLIDVLGFSFIQRLSLKKICPDVEESVP